MVHDSQNDDESDIDEPGATPTEAPGGDYGAPADWMVQKKARSGGTMKGYEDKSFFRKDKTPGKRCRSLKVLLLIEACCRTELYYQDGQLSLALIEADLSLPQP